MLGVEESLQLYFRTTAAHALLPANQEWLLKEAGFSSNDFYRLYDFNLYSKLERNRLIAVGQSQGRENCEHSPTNVPAYPSGNQRGPSVRTR